MNDAALNVKELILRSNGGAKLALADGNSVEWVDREELDAFLARENVEGFDASVKALIGNFLVRPMRTGYRR
jgi:hypothetical protein